MKWLSQILTNIYTGKVFLKGRGGDGQEEFSYKHQCNVRNSKKNCGASCLGYFLRYICCVVRKASFRSA